MIHMLRKQRPFTWAAARLMKFFSRCDSLVFWILVNPLEKLLREIWENLEKF